MMRAVLVFLSGVMLADPAAARSYRVAPDPCPRPAEAAPHVPDRDVDHSRRDWTDFLSPPVVYEEKLGRAEEGRLFTRFVFDPRPPAGEACPR